MDLLISILLGTRLFLFAAGGLAAGEHQASLSAPLIVITKQHLIVNCRLLDGYPRQLRHLAQSSTPILVYLFVELRGQGKTGPTLSSVTESMLSYDNVAKVYKIKMSNRDDTLVRSTLDSAVDRAGDFREMSLGFPGTLNPAQEYQFVLFAVLGKAPIDALEGKAVDLMYYWDYKRPTVKTEWYRGAQLVRAK